MAAAQSGPPNLYAIPISGCPENPREDWVPPEARNETWMKENLGPDSAHTFVYFPKSTRTTPDGETIHVLEVPEDAFFYRGLDMSCEYINNPNDPSCVNCTRYAWYSDYNTVRLYVYGREEIYAYKTKRPLVLLNFLDVRNVQVMVNILVSKLEVLEQAGYDFKTVPEGPPSPPMRHPGMRLPPIYQSPQETEANKLKDYLQCLVQTTHIQLDPSLFDRFWPPGRAYGMNSSNHRAIENGNPPNTNPDEEKLVSAEFGDQTALLRRSTSWADMLILPCIQTCFPELLDGYYAPRYISRTHNNKPHCPDKVRYFFHREMALFATKGRLSRVPTYPLNGCTYQPKGGSRRSIKRRKQQRRRKSRKISSS
jgi:hypothetical protein